MIVIPAEEDVPPEPPPVEEFKFRCPNCNRKLAAESSMIGMEVECPACGITLQIPAPIPAPPGQTPA